MKHHTRISIILTLLLTALIACSQDPPGTAVDELPDGDVERGEVVFSQNFDGAAACSVCHALSSADGGGPGLAGYGDYAGDVVSDESAEEYTYWAILRPARHLVSGYNNVMPDNYEEVLSDQQLADLIAYLLSL